MIRVSIYLFWLVSDLLEFCFDFLIVDCSANYRASFAQFQAIMALEESETPFKDKVVTLEKRVVQVEANFFDMA